MFVAFYLVDENKILHAKALDGINIKECFLDFKTIVEQYNQIKDYDDLDNFKREISKLETRMKIDLG